MSQNTARRPSATAVESGENQLLKPPKRYRRGVGIAAVSFVAGFAAGSGPALVLNNPEAETNNTGKGSSEADKNFVPEERLTERGAVCRWMTQDGRLVSLLGAVHGDKVDPTKCSTRYSAGSDAGFIIDGNTEMGVSVSAGSDDWLARYGTTNYSGLTLTEVNGADVAYCNTEALLLFKTGGALAVISYGNYKVPGGDPLGCSTGLTPEVRSLAEHVAKTAAMQP